MVGPMKCLDPNRTECRMKFRKVSRTPLGDINYSISVSHFAENGTQMSQSSRQQRESKENIIGHLQVRWKEVSVNLHNTELNTGLSLAD